MRGWAAPHAIFVIVNPSAGGGRARKVLPELEGALRARGLDYRLVLTTSPAHGREEALRAAAAGEIVVVMGGDGLVGQIGGDLADGGVPMGVMPGGRGNDLARELGIPTDMRGAVEVLADGLTRRSTSGRYQRRFLCIARWGSTPTGSPTRLGW